MASSNLVDKLSSEKPGEQAAFLNEIVAQLWPNICAAGSEMTKDIVEPMFKSTLPGPLSGLKFTHLDFGSKPLVLNNIRTVKSSTGGIKLDMDVDWDGECDIQLDASMVPALGVRHVKLRGRLSVLLGPLTNIIPLIGAAQVSFVNPPKLELDFTGAANVADFDAIDGAIRGVILGIINSMATLPNRYLLTLDAKNDYFKTFVEPLGVLRVTVEKAWDFAEEAKSGAKKLFAKLTRAAPDCYTKTIVGAEEAFKTTTKDNTTHPSWNETTDIFVTDFDQCIQVHVLDEDVNGDDEVGIAETTVKDILLGGGRHELALTHKGEETGGKVSIACEYFNFQSDGGKSFSDSAHKGEGLMCGVANVLVGGAFGIKGQREQLTPSVKITWGSKHTFQTAVKTDAPGTDINNPTFDQSFRIPMNADTASSGQPFHIALLNGEKEVGGVDVSFDEVMKAPDMTLQKKFDVGGGTTVRASFSLRGLLHHAEQQQQTLPQR